MDSWDGGFSWQGYALTGRPDFLNYLNTGDVTWEDLWEFYRQQAAPPESVRALMRLFHLFLSDQYDADGCWLDPEGEVLARLKGWAAFVLDSADRLPLEDVRADLAGLVASGMVTPLYYQAAYLVFMETSVDRHVSFLASGAATAELAEEPRLPGPDERRLPVYHPGADRLADLQGDTDWDAALRSLLAQQYRSWNSAYAASLPDPEHEEVWTTAGGEG
jgi:hypothetical protein